MHGMYCGCATPHTHLAVGDELTNRHTHTLAIGDADAWADELAKMLADQVKTTWNKKAMPKPSIGVTRAYGQKFEQAVNEGMKIEYDTPDPELKKHLTQKAYQFAAAKNHAQMVQLTRALVDDQGKVRSWSQFKQAAFEINNTHTTTWLKAEYNTAVGSAQMASKWQQIQANKATLPLLQFDAIIDGQTSDLCRSLEGIIKPADDPFWDKYYPPNHFGCRSTVRQLANGKVTPDNKIVHPEKLPKAFQTNLAKTGMLFPKDHPFFIGIPDAELKNYVYALPVDLQFDPVKIEGAKGKLRVHKLVNEKHVDYEIVREIATEYAIKGSKVDIMPNVDGEKQYHDIIFPGAYKYKSPDLRIDDVWHEVESATNAGSYRNLKGPFERGSNQADFIIIDLSVPVAKEKLENVTKLKMGDYPNVKEAIWRYKGNYFSIKK